LARKGVPTVKAIEFYLRNSLTVKQIFIFFLIRRASISGLLGPNLIDYFSPATKQISIPGTHFPAVTLCCFSQSNPLSGKKAYDIDHQFQFAFKANLKIPPGRPKSFRERR
jgi:hypothetical protein